MKVGQSANKQKQQQLQTIRPQRSKTSIRKQNTSKTSGRLSKIGPTFDQLLAKYMKKVDPHNRPINQTKPKVMSMRKQKPTKPSQKVAQPRSPSHPLPGMTWCFPVYSSSMCCPTHVWGGTAMNLYHWPNPFAYLGWGHHRILPIDMSIRQSWLKRMPSEMASVHQSFIKYLYYLIARADDLHRAKFLLREQNNS
jgi:hypothetical protein